MTFPVRSGGAWILATLVAFASPAVAQDASVADVREGGAGPTAPDTADAGQDGQDGQDGQGGGDGGRVWASCMEHVPEGASRPGLENTFPSRGKAGHALPLRVRIAHGLGETALPNGFRIQRDSDAARALASAGFELPEPDGGSPPTLTRTETDGKALTEVVIPFVALPEEPGRHELTLPPVPIAVARASGEIVTLCTSPHTIVIDEPIANETEPAPQGNPPPRPQREVWTVARDLTYGLLAGLVLAALIAWLVVWWRRRPKPPVPPPPPRPPWEVALESLDAIRRDNLVAQGKPAEHVDRVSDVVRIYLGGRYGFDGIESTTDEVLQVLRRMSPPLPVYDEVRRLLQDSDLVKFARWAPADSDCEDVLVAAERIIRETLPKPGIAEDNVASDTPRQGGSA